MKKLIDSLARFTVLVLTLLLIVFVVPVAALFRKNPFERYVSRVALAWLRLCGATLDFCGAQTRIFVVPEK